MAKTKLYSLTDEHREQLKPWADKWINNTMSTKPMDEAEKEICRDAVEGMYRAANLTPPPRNRIVFVPSPFVGRFAAGFAAAIWHVRKTGFKPKIATRDATYDATDAATRDATYDATDAATDAARKNSAGPRKWFSFGLRGMVRLSVEFNLGEFGIGCAQLASRFYQGGNQWSGWASFLSFFRHIAKLEIDYSKWDHYEKLAEHSGWRFVHKEFCIISDRPEVLLVDSENRPHCETGPFCRYRDGSAMYAIHGTRVPMELVETPAEKLDTKEWLAEENVDWRRIAFQKIGAARMAKDLGAEVIDSMVCPVGGPYELLMLDIGVGEKKPYLKMHNPSLKQDHIEGVEITCKTVKDALAWRNGLTRYVSPNALS